MHDVSFVLFKHFVFLGINWELCGTYLGIFFRIEKNKYWDYNGIVSGIWWE
jgi:hypothetical protein